MCGFQLRFQGFGVYIGGRVLMDHDPDERTNLVDFSSLAMLDNLT